MGVPAIVIASTHHAARLARRSPATSMSTTSRVGGQGRGLGRACAEELVRTGFRSLSIREGRLENRRLA